MRSLFEKRMERAKQELTALKTVHDRGLGTIEFFEKTITFNSSANTFYTIRADVATGEPGRPLLFASASASSGYGEDARVVSTYSSTNYVRALVFCKEASTVTASLVASSVITNITRS